VGSTSRPALKTSLLAIGIAIGMGLLFTYFFGFFVGIIVALGIGSVFAIRSVWRATTVRRISIIIGLILGMLLLLYFLGLYGIIVYIVALLVFYFIWRKSKKDGADAPLP
jgi:hypothetical protein